MTIEEWISQPETIEKSKKQYAHFDHRTDLSKCFKYVSTAGNISRHSFYPFIHYKKNMSKYSAQLGKKKPKERDICYASHIDRCIFQYYSFLLNELYNRRIQDDGIFEVPIAYRSDLHKTNIYFSKKAFDFITEARECFIMIGDYTGFFDNLDHQYLKKQWCSLLGVKCLPDDHYAIYKNITRYSYWELDDLLTLNNLEVSQKGRSQINKQALALSHEDFHKYRSHIQRNKDSFGIPQGSPISALLANMYMLEVDRDINRAVTSLGGLYMRYSDDFIVVLPHISEKCASNTLREIIDEIKGTPGLELQDEKTQFFKYENGMLENCGSRFHVDADCSKKTIDFLGFSFDGQNVLIRAKTITKYYYKMNRKAKTIYKNGGYTKKGNRISGKVLYDRYSIKGAFAEREKPKPPQSRGEKRRKGNFLTYVLRAKREYGKGNLQEQITKRHLMKIRKAIKGKGQSNQK